MQVKTHGISLTRICGRYNMKVHIRHQTAPFPNGCRWCGIVKQFHAQRWVAGHGWHIWEPPTDAQRKARLVTRSGRSGESHYAA